MASVTKRLRKMPDGTVKDFGWQVRYVVNRRQKCKKFKTRQEAYDFRTSLDHKLKTGAYVDPDDGRETFREYAERWRAVQPWRPSTQEQAESRLRLWAYPVIGDRSLASVRPTDVNALVKAASLELAPATVEQVVAYVKAVFSGAVKDRLIVASPAVDVAVVDGGDPEPVVPLERAQWVAFTEALPERWRIAGMLGVGAGLRGGEVRGLTVNRVEFLRREIKVDRQMVTLSKAGTSFAKLKTKASRRTIPVSATLLAALAAHVADFPDRDRRRGLLLTMPNGDPVPRARFGAAVLAAATAAELGDKQRFHALRHTYASALIVGGCSVKVVQARMGHATAQETLDTYGHLWPDDDDRTRGAIEAALTAESDAPESAVAPTLHP